MTSYNGTTQTNGYSGDGLRAWKQAGSTRTYFLYDGAAPVCEYNSSGTLLATNTFGADGLASRRLGSITTFYTFDERGNVSQRLSSTGTAQSSDLYDGYGSRSSTGAADVWQFEAQWGYYTDAETGLILCTHRFYDPSSGRWLTRDPIGYEGGMNLYGYVGNDPGNEEDSTGLAPPKMRPGAPRKPGQKPKPPSLLVCHPLVIHHCKSERDKRIAEEQALLQEGQIAAAATAAAAIAAATYESYRQAYNRDLENIYAAYDHCRSSKGGRDD